MIEKISPPVKPPVFLPEALGSIVVSPPQGMRGETGHDLDRAETFRALETLKQVGALLPAADMTMYHGRAAKAQEPEWTVDPSFRNGGDDSGNSNIYKRPQLYATVSKGVARNFADIRAGQNVARRLRARIYEQIYNGQETVSRQRGHHIKMLLEARRYEAMPEDKKVRYRDTTKKYWLADDERRLDYLEQRRTGEEKRVHGDPLTRTEINNLAWSIESAMTPEKKAKMIDEIKRTHAKPELHQIVSDDPDATIINMNFTVDNLSQKQRDELVHAYRTLAKNLPLGMAAPLQFDRSFDAGKAKDLLDKIITHQGWITEDYIAQVAGQTASDKKHVRDLGAAINMRVLIARGHLNSMIERLRDTKDAIVPLGENQKNIPISVEYLENFCRIYHIVGQRATVNSANLSKDIDVVTFFNLPRVNTKKHYEHESQKRKSQLVPIGEAFWREAFRSGGHSALAKSVTKFDVAPGEVVTEAASIEGYKEKYAGDTGVWEGFSLGEHTETALRVFEDNFSDNVPYTLLPLMRLALTVHDIGKPDAVKQGRKDDHLGIGAPMVTDFLRKVGISDRAGYFIRGLVGRGMELATESAVFGDDRRLGPLRDYGRNELQKIMSHAPSEEMVDGYLQICEMLVACDGGAYTPRSITRLPGGGAHRNGNERFERSFTDVKGLGGRVLRLKNAGIAERSRS